MPLFLFTRKISSDPAKEMCTYVWMWMLFRETENTDIVFLTEANIYSEKCHEYMVPWFMLRKRETHVCLIVKEDHGKYNMKVYFFAG